MDSFIQRGPTHENITADNWHLDIGPQSEKTMRFLVSNNHSSGVKPGET